MTRLPLILLLAMGFSQFSYSQGTYWTASGYQLARGKQSIDGGAKTSMGPYNHFAVRMDVISVEAGMWGYVDGSALMAALPHNNKPEYGGIVDIGYGWMFNNERPIRIGSDVEVQLGLGFPFGYRGFNFADSSRAKGGVIFGPDLGSFITVGDKLVLFTKAGISALMYREFAGNRKVFEVNAQYKILDWLAISATPCMESFFFKGPEGTDNMHDIFYFRSVRIGLSLVL